MRAGKVERLVDEDDVIAAMADPPESTRAYFRGTCLARWADSVVAANWDSLVLDVGTDPLRRIPMMEPTRGSKEHVARALRSGVDAPPARRATDGELTVSQEDSSWLNENASRSRRRKSAKKKSSTRVAASSERGEKLKEDIDDLLDEIDSVLEDNAEEFVRSYVQKGGQ